MTPRSEWATHKRANQGDLMLASHSRLRTTMDKLMTETTKIKRLPDKKAQTLSLWFTELSDSLKAHEVFEKQKTFPFLQARFALDLSELNPPVVLSNLHASLGARKKCISDAAGGLARAAEFQPKKQTHEEMEDLLDELTIAMSKLTKELDRHFTEKEDWLIPLMMALDRDEYVEFISTESGTSEFKKLITQSSQKVKTADTVDESNKKKDKKDKKKKAKGKPKGSQSYTSHTGVR